MSNVQIFKNSTILNQKSTKVFCKNYRKNKKRNKKRKEIKNVKKRDF